MDEFRYIGASTYEIKKQLIEKFGKEKFDKILTRMKPEYAEIVKNPVLANEYYPTAALDDFISSMKKEIGDEDFEKICTSVAEEGIKGLHGFMLNFVSVKTIMNRMVGQFSTKISPDKGKLELIKLEDNEIILRKKDFPASVDFNTALNYYLAGILSKVSKKKWKFDRNIISPTITETRYYVV